MRRALGQLAQTTVQSYRSRLRKLFLKIQAGRATPADQQELVELECLLGVRGSEIPPVGRPRKHREALADCPPQEGNE